MTLLDFPITRRWPPRNPDAIQLYSLPTPNGIKAAVMLEECGLSYDAHRVSFEREDQFTPEFLSLNPNNKIPAIIDPNGPDGKPIGLFESGAILIYLARKAGKLLGNTEHEKMTTLQWTMFQMGGIGPMLGQLGFFWAFAGKEIEDPRPRERYINEAKRLLGVLDGELANRDWIAGDYSIADIAIVPWLQTISRFYKAEDATGLTGFKNVLAYIDRFDARPAVQKGWNIPPRD